jgi:phospholipase C
MSSSTPSVMPVSHVFVLMLENHSFDNMDSGHPRREDE